MCRASLHCLHHLSDVLSSVHWTCGRSLNKIMYSVKALRWCVAAWPSLPWNGAWLCFWYHPPKKTAMALVLPRPPSKWLMSPRHTKYPMKLWDEKERKVQRHAAVSAAGNLIRAANWDAQGRSRAQCVANFWTQSVERFPWAPSGRSDSIRYENSRWCKLLNNNDLDINCKFHKCVQ